MSPSEKSAEGALTEHPHSLSPKSFIALVQAMLFILSFPSLLLGQSSGANQTQSTQPSPTCRRSCCRCQGAVSSSGGQATAFVVQQPAEKSDSKMHVKHVVPLLQSLVWALLVGGVLVGWRREIGAALQGRHIKLKIAGVEIEIFAPEQVTDPAEYDVVEHVEE